MKFIHFPFKNSCMVRRLRQCFSLRRLFYPRRRGKRRDPRVAGEVYLPTCFPSASCVESEVMHFRFRVFYISVEVISHTYNRLIFMYQDQKKVHFTGAEFIVKHTKNERTSYHFNDVSDNAMPFISTIPCHIKYTDNNLKSILSVILCINFDS